MACQNTPTQAIGCIPFWLTYGHEGILPLKINIQSLRVAKQNMLSLDRYQQIMLDELDELNEDQLMTINLIQLNKRR